jgi:hypothetical protein
VTIIVADCFGKKEMKIEPCMSLDYARIWCQKVKKCINIGEGNERYV